MTCWRSDREQIPPTVVARTKIAARIATSTTFRVAPIPARASPSTAAEPSQQAPKP